MTPPFLVADISASLKVPKGFLELMEKLAFEIIKNQPSDIIKFASQHFFNLLEARNNTDINPDYAATIIQRCYRGFAERKKFAQKKKAAHIQRTQSATTIQSAFRSYHVRKSKGEVKELMKRADALGLETSAIKIQATYRGYITRKHIKTSGKMHSIAEVKNQTVPQEIKKFLDDVEKAAIIIQKNYKGYAVRKKFQERQNSDIKENEVLFANQNKDDLEKAALVIQKKYKLYLGKKKENIIQPKIFPTNLEENAEKRERAAVVIQKNYKGYIIRKKLHQ